MPRYIDAEKLKAHYSWWECTESGNERKKVFDTIIDLQPTADVVEVVRCKDCIYSQDKRACNLPYGENGYCPLGERRTENIPRVIGTSPTEHLVRCKERREDAET